LLVNVRVGAAIAAAQAERSKRTQITADQVLTEFANLGFANMADYTKVVGHQLVPDLSRCTRDQLGAVQEIIVHEYIDGRGDNARAVRRVKLKLASKQAALDSLARHLGMFAADNKREVGMTLKELVLLSMDDALIARRSTLSHSIGLAPPWRSGTRVEAPRRQGPLYFQNSRPLSVHLRVARLTTGTRT